MSRDRPIIDRSSRTHKALLPTMVPVHRRSTIQNNKFCNALCSLYNVLRAFEACDGAASASEIGPQNFHSEAKLVSETAWFSLLTLCLSFFLVTSLWRVAELTKESLITTTHAAVGRIAHRRAHHWPTYGKVVQHYYRMYLYLLVYQRYRTVTAREGHKRTWLLRKEFKGIKR